MPAGDGTGPEGMGPMTGRGAGRCAGYDMPGYANPMPGRGLGMGWGRRWGRGRGGRFRSRWFHAPRWPRWGRGYAPAWDAPMWDAPPTSEEELGALRNQAEWLKEQLEAIGRRIGEIEREG